MAHISSIRGLTRSSRAKLSFSPQHLTTLDIIYVIFLIAVKHISAFLGIRKPLKASYITEDTFDLPSLSVTAPLQIAEADLRAWGHAVGEEVSILFPAAITTPLMLLLLASPLSPVLPFGAVNTRNRFEFLEPLVMHSYAKSGQAGLVARARFGGSDLKGKRVKRGVEFDVVIEVLDSTASEDGKVIFRQIISTLQFLSSRAVLPPKDANTPAQPIVYGDEQIDLSLDVDAPNRWAELCKDYNPIHMSSFAAKAFGFPSRIAHGNHTVALVLQLISFGQTRLSKSFWLRNGGPSWLEVEFRRPLVVPIVVGVKFSEADHGMLDIAVVKGEKAFVHIRSGPL